MELRRRPARSRAERCLVLDLYDAAVQEGLSRPEAARTCGVSEAALKEWREERRQVLDLLDELERSVGPLVGSS